MPRSYRVAEKSDPIGSREPNCAVFQQNPTVVTAELDAPMDSDAVIAVACNPMHLEKACLSVCRDHVALRRNPIRSAPESQIICCFSAKSDRCDSRTRRSDGPRRCTRASMNFNTFARCIFLCLPRSYRVAEKSDPIARFSGPDRRKS